MRTPARKPSQADTIDKVVTTERPNSTRELVRIAETRLAVALFCMVPAAIWRQESCKFIPHHARLARGREHGESGVKPRSSRLAGFGEGAAGMADLPGFAGVLPDHRE